MNKKLEIVEGTDSIAGIVELLHKKTGRSQLSIIVDLYDYVDSKQHRQYVELVDIAKQYMHEQLNVKSS